MKHFRYAIVGTVMWLIPIIVELPQLVNIMFSFLSGSMFGLILRDLIKKEK